MNKERYNQVIDEAYEDYLKKRTTANKDNVREPVTLKNGMTGERSRRFTKEEFINKIKTDQEFSERWGLKIEERELSLNERGELFRKNYPNKSVDDFRPGGMEVQSLTHQLDTRYNNANIPIRAITLTYKDEQIKFYE